MEKVHRDLKLLKIFDYVFLGIAVLIISSIFWINSQLSALPSIERHIDQIVGRLENHENRLSFIENRVK